MQNSDAYLIVCGKLYDGIRDTLRDNMEILVEGNRIKKVGRDIAHTPEVTIIDLSHLTVTPGLIDAHIHSDVWDINEYFPGMYTHSEEWKTLAHLHTAQRCLERGFTTIRCHSASLWNYGVVDVKKMIEQGYFHGSRMKVACHLLGTPGSHSDNSQFLAGYPVCSELCSSPNIGTGADFFRNAVRKEVKYGGDFIKLFLSGGFSTPNDGPEDQQMCDEEIEAVISTAKALHTPVTAHVYSPALMKKLISYGITGMEHGSLMDEETARLFEETNTYLVPTFAVYDDVIMGNEENMKKKSVEFQEKLREYSKRLKESREIIKNSKIRLGYGSDFLTVHQVYESSYEFESWMKNGMDAFRILQAATMNNAEILEMQNQIGSIEPGKLADIAAWRGDLLTDPLALNSCDFVMKDGVIYKCEGYKRGEFENEFYRNY